MLSLRCWGLADWGHQAKAGSHGVLFGPPPPSLLVLPQRKHSVFHLGVKSLTLANGVRTDCIERSPRKTTLVAIAQRALRKPQSLTKLARHSRRSSPLLTDEDFETSGPVHSESHVWEEKKMGFALTRSDSQRHTLTTVPCGDPNPHLLSCPPTRAVTSLVTLLIWSSDFCEPLFPLLMLFLSTAWGLIWVGTRIKNDVGCCIFRGIYIFLQKKSRSVYIYLSPHIAE